MNIILLSGGSGKRLWPLSNDSRSKQFLKLLPDGAGGKESMLQRVCRQLDQAGLLQSAFIATGRGQLDMIESQIGRRVPFIIEPERRDTFPAIALAAAYLYTAANVGLDESVVVMPVDSYVEDRFFGKLTELDAVLAESRASLALVGVQPTYPSEKYGYIVPDGQAGEGAAANGLYRRVSHFREKPKEEQARELIGQAALWNCGIFAFRLGYLIDILIGKQLPVQYESLKDSYQLLAKTSFDYEVVEKTDSIVVTPYDGKWKDLGTWNTLTEEMAEPVIGDVILSGESRNTHVINELNIPVTVLGLPDAIVAASPDGILIAEKSLSPRIKEVMQENHQRPMYEERRWGWYRVIDYFKSLDGIEVLTKRICIRAGQCISYQYHLKRSEAWTVVSGEGEIVLNQSLKTIRAGDVIQVPVGARHSIRALRDLEIIEVQRGSELIEEDIVRISLDWDEVLKEAKAF